MVQWIKRTEREVIHVREVISLNGGWQFFAQPERFEPPFAAPGPEGLPVTLPHSWNAEDGQSGNGYARQCCCYQRPLTLPAGGECFYLEFQGANSVCRAWLDETFLGEHRGGYSAFRFDITGLCRPGGQALLTVFVDNRETADVSPLAGDFTIFGGLYRDVNLICVPRAHFDLLYWGTAGVLLTPAVDPDGAARLAVETHLVRGGERPGAVHGNRPGRTDRRCGGSGRRGAFGRSPHRSAGAVAGQSRPRPVHLYRAAAG